MPLSITDASSFDAMTAPTGTDIRNAASVLASLQQIANRTRFLLDRASPVATIAALKAIASPADGLVRLVKGYGFYVFDGASAVAETLPSVVQPTVGTGRWLSVFKSSFNDELALLKGLASGLASLDGSAKVPVAQIPLALLSAQFVDFIPSVGGSFSTTSTSFVDVTGAPGLSVTVASCQVGDILVIDATIQGSESTASNGLVRLVAVDPSVVAACGATPWLNTSAQGIAAANISCLYTVVTAGSIVIKAQVHGSGGNTASIFQGSNLRVLHYRP